MSVGDATSARRLEVGGIGLNVLDDGEGPAVLLLHGFPDSLDLWRHQVPALTGSGFRVVGHDWGAALAWGLAALHPERVERLVAISVGHPATFPGSMEQRALSWYMLFFQFPEAEEALRRDDWRFFREAFGGGGDLDRYIEDLSRPGRLTAGLNWYRANISPESFVSAISSAVPAVSCPTLGVWSSGDVALTEHQMTSSAANVNGPWRYERIDDASHWIPVDAPERLNELLIDFLTGEESR